MLYKWKVLVSVMGELDMLDTLDKLGMYIHPAVVIFYYLPLAWNLARQVNPEQFPSLVHQMSHFVPVRRPVTPPVAITSWSKSFFPIPFQILMSKRL